MVDQHLEDADEPMPLRTKIVAGVVLAVVALVALVLIARMGSPAISVSRAAPAGHYPLPCPVCHTMTAEPPAGGTP
jgi:hypothetical protein